MDPELKKALADMRATVEEAGKRNADVGTRMDEIEKAAEERSKTTVELRAEIDALKQGMEERDGQLKDMTQKMRVQRASHDPIQQRRDAVEMFGMQGRAILARHFNCDLPERFRGEEDLVREYNKTRATVQESTGGGAVFIPTVLENEIMDTLEELGDVLPLVDLQTGLPTKGTIPTLTGRPTLQPKRASSDTAMTASDFAFSSLDYDTDETYLIFPVDRWLMELSPFQLGAWLMPRTVEAFMLGLEDWLMNADGTSSYNSDTGILNEATYVTSMLAGKIGFADVDNLELNRILSALLKRGRARGVFMMSNYVQGLLEDLARQGKIPVLTVGQDGQYRCKQRRVVIDESMPDEADNAANTAFMTVGDLSAMLLVIAGQGIRVDVSREVFFNKNQDCIRAMAHIDLRRKPVNILRNLKTAAE